MAYQSNRNKYRNRTNWVVYQTFSYIAPSAKQAQVLKAMREAHAGRYQPNAMTIKNVAYHLYADGFHNFGNSHAKGLSGKDVVAMVTNQNKQAHAQLVRGLNTLTSIYNNQHGLNESHQRHQVQTASKSNNKYVSFPDIAEQLKPYTSGGNLKQLSLEMNNTKYPKDVVDKTIKMLQHLSDTGADYTLTTDSFTNHSGKTSMRLNAVLSDTKNKVRLLTDNADYVGTVMTRQGEFVMFHGHAPADPYELIDYAAGNLNGAVLQSHLSINAIKNSNHRISSNLLIKDPISHHIDRFGFRFYHKSLMNTRSALLNYDINRDGGAKPYIQAQILNAKNIYADNVLGEDATGVNDQISADQKTLTQFMLDNGILDTDKKLAEKAAYSVVAENSSKTSGLEDINLEENPKAQKLFDKAQSLADDRIGNYENGFDPNIVINMNIQQEYNPTNALYVALNQVNYPSDKLTNKQKNAKSLTKIRDHMVHFDDQNIQYTDQSKPNDFQSLFKIKVLQYVKDTLNNDLANANNKDPQIKVAMDNHGIIRWEGNRTVAPYNSPYIKNQHVSGEIGQIFAPHLPTDAIKYATKHHFSNAEIAQLGILSTNFGSGQNFNIVPGIKGWFQFKGVDKGLNRMQRLRGRDFSHMLGARIKEDLDSQLLRPGSGDLTSARDDVIINGLYHSELIGKRLPNHWFENSHMKIRDKVAKLETLRGRVSFGKRLGELTQDMNRDGKNQEDNPFAKLTDGKKMSNLPSDYRNTFDMDFTSGGKNQGMVLYLDKGAHLSPKHETDGTYRIMPVPKAELEKQAKAIGIDPKLYTAQAPVGYLPYFKYLQNMPWDRKSVAKKYFTNEAYNVSPNTRTAYMTFGGDNFEDSTVVSKDFADKNQVPDRDNYGNIQHNKDGSIKMRPLKTGDKIDDFGHNKATIGQIIDPDMSPEEAKARGLSKEVAIFKQNPGLSVVMSPHSLITRGNGAVAREMMDDGGKYIKPVIYRDANGKVHKLGESSLMNFMTTVLTSDKQTTVYDKANIAKGKERKLSSQMVWGLMAQEYKDPATGKVHYCGRNILKHVFGNNGHSLSNYREYMLPTGLDIDKFGNLHTFKGSYWKNGKLVKPNVSYHPTDHRQMFVANPSKKFIQQHPDYKAPKSNTNFLKELGSKGGMLLLPFNVELAASSKSRPIITNEIPIMSAKLRRNTQLDTGSLKLNDYNELYSYNKISDKSGIFADAMRYRSNQNKFNQARVKGDSQKMHKYSKAMSNAQKDCQSNVSTLGWKLADNELGGPKGTSTFNKHSFTRDHLLSKKVPHSATAVAQNDMRMPLDTIAVSPHIYHTLFNGAKPQKTNNKNLPSNMKADPKYKNTYIMLHRDPVIHAGSERGFKVVEDPDMGPGFRMNPVNANSFEGDFDGDTYGVINISSHDKGVQEDLKHMSVPYHLIDHSGGTIKNGKAVPTPTSYLDVSTDFISGAVQAGVVNPDDKKASPKAQLQQKLLKAATEKVTDDNGKVNGKKTVQRRTADTSKLVKKCMRNDFGAARMDVRNSKAMYNSMSDIVNRQGAKGSPKALKMYMNHFHGRATLFQNFMDGAVKNKLTYGDSKETKDSRLNTRLNDIAQEPKAGLRHSQVKSLVKQAFISNDGGKASKDANMQERLKKSAESSTVQVLEGTVDHTNGEKNLVGAFNKNAMLYEDEAMQNALSAKSFNTASAGTKPQETMSAIGDKHTNLALDTTAPATQANLQGKHHKELIPAIDKLLDSQNGEIHRLLNGKDVATGKLSLPKKEWSREFQRSYHNAGIDVNPKYVDKLSDVLSDGRPTVQPLSKIKAEHGAPLFKVAYTGTTSHPGGFGALKAQAYHNDYAASHNGKQDSLYDGLSYLAPKEVRKTVEHPVLQNEYEHEKNIQLQDPRMKQIQSDFNKLDKTSDFDSQQKIYSDISEIMSGNHHDLQDHDPKYYKEHSQQINSKTYNPSVDHSLSSDQNLSKYYQKLSNLRNKTQETDPKHVPDVMVANDTEIDTNKQAKETKLHVQQANKEHLERIRKFKAEYEQHLQQKALAKKVADQQVKDSDKQAKDQEETVNRDSQSAQSSSSASVELSQASQSAQPSKADKTIKNSAKSIDNQLDLTKGLDDREDTGVHPGGLESHKNDFSKSMNNESSFSDALKHAKASSSSQRSNNDVSHDKSADKENDGLDAYRVDQNQKHDLSQSHDKGPEF